RSGNIFPAASAKNRQSAVHGRPYQYVRTEPAVRDQADDKMGHSLRADPRSHRLDVRPAGAALRTARSRHGARYRTYRKILVPHRLEQRYPMNLNRREFM